MNQTQSMRVRYPHQFAPLLLALLIVLPLLAHSASCAAQAPVPNTIPDKIPAKIPDQAPAAQTTLAIFLDQPMPDDLWPSLVAALREQLDSGSLETRVLIGETTGHAIASATEQAAGKHLSNQVQIVRGDAIEPGLLVEKSITVRLHGECRITPRPRPILFDDTMALAQGTLGWVRSDHGHIEPFVHVECSRLGLMLATQAFGLDRDRRNRLMAVAIARVILHEWIHIASQNPHHSEHGLAKAQFGVTDLLAHPARHAVQPGS